MTKHRVQVIAKLESVGTAILCHNQKIHGHAKRIAGFIDAPARPSK